MSSVAEVYNQFISVRSAKQKKLLLGELLKDKNIYTMIVKLMHPESETLQIVFSKNEIKRMLSKARNMQKFRSDVLLTYLDMLSKFKSVEQRRTVIKTLPNKLTRLELHFLLNLINRDFGVGYKILAELIDELPYSPFQLAQKYNEKTAQKVKKQEQVIIQPKYDGIRAQFNPETFIWCTRNQKMFNAKQRPNLQHLANQFEQLLEQYPLLSNYVFDGELYALDWNDTMTYVSSYVPVEGSEKLMFIVYDLIDLSSYKSFKPSSGRVQIVDERPQIERIKQIKQLFPFDKSTETFYLTDNIKFAPITLLSAEETTLTQILNYYLNTGYEGCMIKLCDSVYVDGRKDYWLKLKPQNELECVIVDTLEGNGKYQSSLGALIVETLINGKSVRFKVGSGFSDDQRKELWKMKDELIGKIIEIRYQELTPYSIPRFPTFLRIRDDKKEPNFT